MRKLAGTAMVVLAVVTAWAGGGAGAQTTCTTMADGMVRCLHEETYNLTSTTSTTAPSPTTTTTLAPARSAVAAPSPTTTTTAVEPAQPVRATAVPARATQAGSVALTG